MRKNILTLVLILFSLSVFSQIKNIGNIISINNYTKDDYKGERPNWIAVQDHRGLMYFGNSCGSVLEFDGQIWNKIDVSDKSITSLCVGSQNMIFVGGDNVMGFLQPTSNGELKFESLKEKIPVERQNFQKIWDIFITSDSSVFFQTFEEIFLYKNGVVKVIPLEDYYPKGLFLMSYKVGSEIYVYTKYKGLYQLNGDKLDFISASSKLANSMVRAVLPYDANSIIIFTWYDGVFTLSDNVLYKKKVAIDTVIDKNLYRAIRISDDYFGIQLRSGGYLITDNDLSPVQFINSDNGLYSDIVYRSMVDNQNNIWLCTNNGISSVYPFSPLTIFDKNYGFSKNTTTFSAYKYKSNLYVGTTSGVYFKHWDKEENKLNYQPFVQIENPNGHVKIYDFDTIDNKLIASSENGLFSIEDYQANYFTGINSNSIRGVKKFIKPFDNDSIIIGIAKAMIVYKKENNTWKQYYDFSDISGEYIKQDKEGYVWIANTKKQIFKIKFNSFYNEILEKKIYSADSSHGLTMQNDCRLFILDDEILYSTQSGIYKYNNQKDSFYLDTFLNKVIGEGVFVNDLLEDNCGDLWCKKEVKIKNQKKWELGYFKKTNNLYTEIYKPFLPLKDDIYFFEQLSRNTFVIGVSNSFVHYDNRIKDNIYSEFPIIIKSVKISNSDSVLFGGIYVSEDTLVSDKQLPNQIPIIKHKNANLRFTFAGAYYRYPEKIEYKYFLEGNDADWSEWTTENYRDYSNLMQGEYTFYVKARNIYKEESQVATYKFEVKAPWYLTFMAFFSYFVLAGIIMWRIIHWNTSRLRKRNEKLERQVQERTKEIQEQKEEIQKINKDLTASIEYAKRIQTAMLPLDTTIEKYLKDYFILFKPRDIVSGDFYWFAHKDNYIYISAIDCTGHGVPGAFMSMIGSQILTTIVNTPGITDTAQILTELNIYIRKALKQDTIGNQDGMDMAMCKIDINKNILEFSGAKNSLFYIENDEIKKVRGSRQSIGGFQFGDFKKHIIEYKSPTWFYASSDGYPDQFGGEDGSKFMTKNLKKILLSNHKKTPEEQKYILEKTINDWKKNTYQTDDILVIGFKL